MKPIESPIAAEICRDSAFLKTHGTFFVKFVAEVVHDNVDKHGIRAGVGMAQGVDKIRYRRNLGIGEGGFDSLRISELAPFFLQRVSGVKVRPVGGYPVRHETMIKDSPVIVEVAIHVGPAVG